MNKKYTARGNVYAMPRPACDFVYDYIMGILTFICEHSRTFSLRTIKAGQRLQLIEKSHSSQFSSSIQYLPSVHSQLSFLNKLRVFSTVGRFGIQQTLDCERKE